MAKNRLASRLGFLLLSAGCAIGLGNVWKFPWMVGQGGGAAFVLVYLVFLIILGLPVMTCEFAIGRAAQKSPVKMYQQLEKPGQKWHIHGYISMAANYALMAFYVVVAGWVLKYFVDFLSNNGAAQAGVDNAAVGEAFGATISNNTSMILYALIIVVVGVAVCAFDVSKVLEKTVKWMMLGLFVLMFVLAIHGIRLDLSSKDAGAGLLFYLKPDFSKINISVVYGAMKQAFFTLSLGIGAMAIFGSYIGKDHSLMGESARVIGLDTLAAFMAGLIIFPACFAFGVTPDAGPSLIFVTLPQVFNSMALGRLWGTLFFLFFTFAALSTVFAVFENCIAMSMDAFGWGRRKSCGINLAFLFAISLPVVFGFTDWAAFQPLGEGTGVMDLLDFFVSTLALPIGSLIYVVYCTRKSGWGWDNFTAEANAGKGMKVKQWMFFYMKWILPVIIAVVLILGLLEIFGVIKA
ncbi:MAG: sodium-dependent transporter [Lachnospiraceae bacterium]|nr:sodium-dependent transporter [Lachnospiraceae bacterium]